MLSARSVVILIVATITLGLVINVLSLRRDPDSGGVGRDSFGIRAHGYRGVLETLDRLGVEAQRRIGPPGRDYPAGTTVALLAPSPKFYRHEPAYLERLAEWVEGGGRVLVAPPTDATRRRHARFNPNADDIPEADLLTSLGLGEVELLDKSGDASKPESEEERFWDAAGWRESRSQGLAATRAFRWENDADPLNLRLPGDGGIRILPSEAAWRPLLTSIDEDSRGDESVLAAAYPRGSGEVVLVADPDLFANALLAEQDNPLAVVRLLSPEGGPVVFDEHYHGLSTRGNVLFLLTIPGFAAVLLATIAASGVWAWRTAIALGPPVATPAKPRRDLSEYIRAMARLFLRGRDGRRFLLTELRQGTIEELGRQLNLPPLTTSPDRAAASLARRDGARARKFVTAIQAIDRRLAEPGRLGERETTELMQGATSCL